MENRGDKDENLYYIITGAYSGDSGRRLVISMPPIAKSTRFRRVVPTESFDGIEGRGQFVGVTLATGMNGNNTCWVEGEARMYLDDDPYSLSTIPELKTTSAVPMDLEMTSSSRAIRPSALYRHVCNLWRQPEIL